jgi:hypothetical protein
MTGQNRPSGGYLGAEPVNIRLYPGVAQVVLAPGDGCVYICRDDQTGPDLKMLSPLQRALMAVRLRMLADRLEEEA